MTTMTVLDCDYISNDNETITITITITIIIFIKKIAVGNTCSNNENKNILFVILNLDLLLTIF